jgi:hypothetical protein
MNLLAYAIVRDADPFRGPLPDGLTGGPLALVAAGGLAFACSPAPPGEPDVPRLLAFAGVVQALHARGTVLPLRFGAVGPADAFRAKIAARRDEFAADLARLDGFEEMTVRVPLPKADEPPAPPPTSGAAYLLARRRQYDRADARRAAGERFVAVCRERLAGLFADVAHDRPVPTDATLAVHFLIPRGTGPEFAAAARRAEGLPDNVRVLGPWPAYHFLTPPPALLPDAADHNG